MSKVKLVSDIMKVMKDKETVTGTMKVAVIGPDLELNLTKKFDAEEMHGHHGRGCHGRGHGFRRGFGHGPGRHGHGNCEGHGPDREMMKRFHEQMMEDGGIDKDSEEFKKMKEEMKKSRGHGPTWKDKMAMISTALDLFNSIKVEELDDGNTVLTLSKDELSEDLLERIHSGMERNHRMMKAHHGRMRKMHGEDCEGHGPLGMDHDFHKHIQDMKNPSVNMKWTVNGKKEVIKAEINLSGEMPEGPAKLDATVDFD